MNKQAIENHFAGHFQDFFARYLPAGVKKIGGSEWQALCPFHKDTKPSLNINEQTGAYYCHGCGKKGGFLHFYAKLNSLDDRRDFPKILAGIARDFKIEAEEVKAKLVKTYDYTDEAGTLLFQVCRYEPKSFRQRRPDGNGGWVWDLKGVRRVPYRLPAIIKVPEVVIVEGEKDADTLVSLGFQATCCPMGAGKWRAEYNEPLKGKGIYLIGDNDAPGRGHIEQIARSLNGHKPFVKVVELPSLGESQDVSDFVRRFKTRDEAVGAISGLMAQAKEWKPTKPECEAAKDEASARTCIELQTHFSRTIEYLWRSHIVRGMPVMVNAREGVGKSTICLGIAREIIEANPAGLVLWVACEGQLSNTLNQADEIGIFQSPRFRVAELAPGDYLFKFDRPDHLRKFSRLLERLSAESPVLAVFIDSIRGMTSYGDNDSEVGNVMMAVNGVVCDRHGAGLIYIDHWKKGKSEKDNPHSLLDKAVGSTAKTSAVRLVLSVLPASKFKRVLKEAKNNLGKPAPELEVLKSGGRLVFHEAKRATEQSMKEKAEELLFDLFAERQRIPASEIAEEGEKRGVSFDVLKKVKDTLGVDSIKDAERWWWIWDAFI